MKLERRTIAVSLRARPKRSMRKNTHGTNTHGTRRAGHCRPQRITQRKIKQFEPRLATLKTDPEAPRGWSNAQARLQTHLFNLQCGQGEWIVSNNSKLQSWISDEGAFPAVETVGEVGSRKER